VTTLKRPDAAPWSPIGKRRHELILRLQYLTERCQRLEHRNAALEHELKDWATRFALLESELTRLGVQP